MPIEARGMTIDVPPGDALPADVYPESRNRLPLLERDALDDDGKRLYDIATSGTLIAGLQGPTGLRLAMPMLGLLKREVNDYLRFHADLDPALCELTILIAARETDQHFEWNAHEAAALKFGLPVATIDVVRLRKPVDGLTEFEAVLIALGREAMQQRAVAAATFAAALRVFGAQKLQGYVTLMSEYVATAVFLTIFDQQLPAGRESTLP